MISFPPVADSNAIVLILGSFPSAESLRKNEYYANPRNVFWKIMAELFKFNLNTSFEERTEILKKNNIALWDVLQTCERRGSLDSAIDKETIVENDFAFFYRSHPRIRYVYFNGTTAEKEYLKRILPTLHESAKKIRFLRLPSTSPAMAQLSFDEKLSAWKKIKLKSS